MFGRVHRRDAENETDRRIGRRSASLAQNVLAPCHLHDIEDGKEVGGVVQLADQREFALDLGSDLCGHTVGIAQLRPPPGDFLKPCLRSPALGNRFFGILITQLIERKIDGLQEHLDLGDGLRALVKQPLHFLGRLEMAFRIDLQSRAGRFNGYPLPDAGEDIVQVALPDRVIEHVIGGDQGHPMGLSQTLKVMKTPQIIALVAHAHPQPEGCRNP